MTAEQANAFFDSMGFEATFATEEVPVTKTGRGTVTVTKPLGKSIPIKRPDGSVDYMESGYETYTYPGQPYTYTDYVETIAMEANSKSGGHKVPQITSLTRKATGKMNNSSSSNAGGSGGKGGGGSSKARSKEVDRYHEINAKIAENKHAIEMLDQAEGRAYGQDKIDLMTQKIALLEEQRKLYEELAKEAQNYYDKDKANLEKYGATFNEDGTIANYDAWYGE